MIRFKLPGDAPGDGPFAKHIKDNPCEFIVVVYSYLPHHEGVLILYTPMRPGLATIEAYCN